MKLTIPQTLTLFYLYAFLGWCMEVAYAAFKESRFVNRGFLNGPVCPIYGFGVIGVTLLLEPIEDRLVWLFLGSMVVTTLIEFLTGFFLERLFHARWWDYSDKPLNVMGYICLRCSLLWGVACVVVVRFVHPTLRSLVTWMPDALTLSLSLLMTATLIADIAATLATIRRLNERLKRLSELASEIHALSDELGQRISEGTIHAHQRAIAGEERLNEEMQKLSERRAETGERLEQGRRAMADRIGQKREAVTTQFEQGREAVADRINQYKDAGRRRLTALKSSFAGMLDEWPMGQRRLLSAFPHLASVRHPEALDALKESYARYRANRRRKDKNNDSGQGSV